MSKSIISDYINESKRHWKEIFSGCFSGDPLSLSFVGLIVFIILALLRMSFASFQFFPSFCFNSGGKIQYGTSEGISSPTTKKTSKTQKKSVNLETTQKQHDRPTQESDSDATYMEIPDGNSSKVTASSIKRRQKSKKSVNLVAPSQNVNATDDVSENQEAEWHVVSNRRSSHSKK